MPYLGALLCIWLCASCGLSPLFSQTSFQRTFAAGSYVIAMDTANQSWNAPSPPFNLNAYGLANQILQNYIPLFWTIDPTKNKDSTDFSALCSQVYPQPFASQTLDFKAGPFIIDQPYTQKVDQIIMNFGNDVEVYRLDQPTTVTVFVELGFTPRVAVLDEGTGAGIVASYFTQAGIDTTSSSIIWNRVTTDSLSLPATDTCYSFAVDYHLDPLTPVTTGNVRSFVESGGNFMAACHAIEAYENVERFQTSTGITVANVIDSNLYLQPAHPFLQFEGNLYNFPGGDVVSYLPIDTFQVTGFPAVQKTSGEYQASSIDRLPLFEGGEVLYLGGHDYNRSIFRNDIEWINGVRMFMNALLMPNTRPSQCQLDFRAEIGVTKTLLNPSPHYIGDTLVYQIEVCNNGPGWGRGVVIFDSLSSNQLYASDSVSAGIYDVFSNHWNLPMIPPGTCDTLWLTVETTGAGPSSNTAYLYDPVGGNQVANDTGQVFFMLSAYCDAEAMMDSLVCGNEVPISATPFSGGTGRWEIVSGSGTVQNPMLPNTLLTGMEPGNTVLYWIITDGFCTDTAEVVISRTFEDPFAGNDTTLCEFELQLQALDPSPAAGVWSGPNGAVTFQDSTAANSQAFFTNSGTTTLQWSVTDGQCAASDTIDIQITPLVAGAGPDQEVCDSAIQLSAVPFPSGTGTWSLGSGGGSIDSVNNPSSWVQNVPVGQSTFLWRISDSVCSGVDTVLIDRYALPSPAEAGMNQSVTTIEALLNATPPTLGLGQWTGSGGVIIVPDDSPFGIAQNLNMGENVLIWSVRNGPCAASEDSVLIVREELQIPSGFSPNGDATNDAFVIPGITEYSGTELLIYNRWGNVVFAQKNYQNDWIGNNSEGVPLASDTYYYVLTLEDQSLFKGFVILRR